MFQVEDLCQVVRAELKSQGLTIQRFATILEVSEPTLKRWLAGKGVSLEDWTRMLAALDLTLSDVVAKTQAEQSRQFEYTPEQEAELAKTPGLLAFFQALLNGKGPKQIARVHKLSEKSLAFYLRRLDAVGLIEWTEGFSARVLKTGEPKWRKGGELAKVFRSRVYREFVESKREDLKIGFYEIESDDLVRLKEIERELFLFARQAERRAKATGRPTTSYGLAVLIDRFSPDFLQVIPERA